MLTVGGNQDGRLEVFARGGDGAVWHNWQTAPNNGWSGWDSLGGWIDRISVAGNADGRLEIFARGDYSGMLEESYEKIVEQFKEIEKGDILKGVSSPIIATLKSKKFHFSFYRVWILLYSTDGTYSSDACGSLEV